MFQAGRWRILVTVTQEVTVLLTYSIVAGGNCLHLNTSAMENKKFKKARQHRTCDNVMLMGGKDVLLPNVSMRFLSYKDVLLRHLSWNSLFSFALKRDCVMCNVMCCCE